MDSIFFKFKSKLNLLIIIFSISLVPFSNALAEKGCCSKHGGVASCNAATGFLMCKDGKQSDTCKCSGTTTKSYKPAKSTISPIFGTSTTTQEKSKAKSEAKSKEKAAKKKLKPVNTRGCCKGHGGVSGCDKSGHQKCKDGTISQTCICQ